MNTVYARAPRSAEDVVRERIASEQRERIEREAAEELMSRRQLQQQAELEQDKKTRLIKAIEIEIPAALLRLAPEYKGAMLIKVVETVERKRHWWSWVTRSRERFTTHEVELASWSLGTSWGVAYRLVSDGRVVAGDRPIILEELDIFTLDEILRRVRGLAR